MPQSIKLTYFDPPARGEPARLCLIHAGIEFEDKRVSFEDWFAMKPGVLAEDNNLFKQPYLPWLEVDGDIISQSLAIARYAAAISGLAGKTLIDKAKVDMMLGIYNSIVEAVMPLMFTADDQVDEAIAKHEPALKKHIPVLEKTLEANSSGWLVGDSVTVADLAIFSFRLMAGVAFGKVGRDVPECVDTPLLKANWKRVSELPNIKAYCDKRAEMMRQAAEQAKASEEATE